MEADLNRKSRELYLQVFRLLDKYIDAYWDRLVFYGILLQDSYCMKFYLSGTDGSCLDCLSMKGASPRALRGLWKEINYVLRRCRKNQGESWSSVILEISADGSFKAKYGYDDFSKDRQAKIKAFEEQLLADYGLCPDDFSTENWAQRGSENTSLSSTESKAENNFKSDASGKSETNSQAGAEVKFDAKASSGSEKSSTVAREEDPRNQLPSVANRLGKIETGLLVTKNGIDELTNAYKKIVSEILDVDKTFSGYFYEEGIRKLCLVLEKFRLIEDFDFKDSLTQELEYILTAHFQAVPFAPSAGEAFNSAEQERIDTNMKGSLVASCAMSGWKLGNRVIVRAVVETK